MFKVDEIWLTRNGNKVKVTKTDIKCYWYPIEVQNIVTNEKYTVSKEGSEQDLIERIK